MTTFDALLDGLSDVVSRYARHPDVYTVDLLYGYKAAALKLFEAELITCDEFTELAEVINEMIEPYRYDWSLDITEAA